MISQAAAFEERLFFYSINGSKILSKISSGEVHILREVFKEAETKAPAIFIDQLESLVSLREHEWLDMASSNTLPLTGAKMTVLITVCPLAFLECWKNIVKD